MNNKISNPKTETPSGIYLNDKDYLTELLSCLKDLEKNYTIAMTEASNEILYSKFYDMFLSISSLQREVYELMFRKGWYIVEKAEVNKINEKYQNLTKELQDLRK